MLCQNVAKLLILVAVSCAFSFLATPFAMAQQSEQPQGLQPQTDELPITTADAVEDLQEALDPELVSRIEDWIETLGSAEFAERERAAAELMDVGLVVVPRLQLLSRDTGDAEVRLRADQIVRQLTRGDLQTRINDFLAGAEVGFDGWDVIRAMLGDSGGIRELFVELMQAHPEVVASMEGTTRDRVLALEKSIAAIQKKTLIDREVPNRADTFALILPTVDTNVPVTAGYESVMLSTLKKHAATTIRQDAQLAPPFRALLGRWMIRSTLSSRIDVLYEGMTWDVAETLPLAIATLSEADTTETLAIALQAISRFGTEDDVVFVRPLLDDDRPVGESGSVNGKLFRAEIRDVAMATIAVLYDADLEELGFGKVEVHPVYGLLRDTLGFPLDDPQSRQLVRQKIDQLPDGP